MNDYSALLYDPVYAALGVPATFSAGIAANATITVIDDTRKATASSSSMGMRSVSTSQLEMRSVGPGAFARIPELERNGITRDDYLDAQLTFNGRSWVIRNFELGGSPNGEDLGEVRFLLKESQ